MVAGPELASPRLEPRPYPVRGYPRGFNEHEKLVEWFPASSGRKDEIARDSPAGLR
jgi:hypothetical protein